MPALYLSNPPLAHHDGQRIQTKTAKPRRRVPPLSLSTSAGKRALASIIEVCASRVGVAHAARRGRTLCTLTDATHCPSSSAMLSYSTCMIERPSGPTSSPWRPNTDQPRYSANAVR